MSTSDWLRETVIEEGLLESDIGEASYNAATDWNPSSALNQSPKLMLADENPFRDLKINDTSPLGTVSGRTLCKECGKSRKYYCYSCCVPLPETAPLIPVLPELPLQVDILKHRREIDGKSTATHAKVICPSHVRIFIYPELPPDLEDDNVVLLFPGPASKSIPDYLSSSKRHRIDRVIFIDATWNQAKGIYADPRIRSLPTLILQDRETLFWRYQTGMSKECLSTIEAIYYFVNDYHTLSNSKAPEGAYDNLLFLFKFMFEKIHLIYGRENLRRYSGNSSS